MSEQHPAYSIMQGQAEKAICHTGPPGGGMGQGVVVGGGGSVGLGVTVGIGVILGVALGTVVEFQLQ